MAVKGMTHSIQSRLTIAFIGLAVGPLLLIGAFLAWQGFSVQQQQALSLQREIALRTANHVAAYVEDLENDLDLIGRVGRIHQLDPLERRQQLQELLRYEKGFEELFLLDETGKEQFRISRNQLDSRAYLMDRSTHTEYLIPARRGVTYYSPISFHVETQEPLMSLAIPIWDEQGEEVTAVLGARIRMRPIWEMIATSWAAKDENIYILDIGNRVIAHRDPEIVTAGTHFVAPKEDGVHEGLDGTSVVLAISDVQLGDHVIRIVAEKPTASALAFAIYTVRLTTGVILAALLVATVLQVLTVRQIVRPIRALATVAQEISGGELTKQAEINSNDEIGDLARAFNSMTSQLRQILEGLEQQVAERTRDLERRALQLEVAAEVGQAASSLLDLEELLNTTVALIRKSFGFYHAQVFLIDEEGEIAWLRASTGQIGQQLLARGHHLVVGSQSVIGQVTASGQPVVAHDTDTDTVHRHNELLQATRSECAVPLRVGARVIGALDVQSSEPNAFQKDDIAMLQTLADQLAIAIENARAYRHQLEAAERLRELDELKMQFIANMSHELRTPLNSIIGFSRVILKGIDGPISDLQRADLEIIHSSGQHLLNLINDILDISKIEAGRMDLDISEVKLQQVIEGVFKTTAGLIKDKPIRLRKEISEELPLIQADGTRIQQVLLNLMANAAKFTEKGEIQLIARANGEAVSISISDTGPGIPEKNLEHLFEPFYQVDGSATRKAGGTGLGLAITRHFVTLHGGEISVSSRVGEGTTFSVLLPIAGPPNGNGTENNN